MLKKAQQKATSSSGVAFYIAKSTFIYDTCPWSDWLITPARPDCLFFHSWFSVLQLGFCLWILIMIGSYAFIGLTLYQIVSLTFASLLFTCPWTWKHWHSHTVFKLSCSACSARTSRLSVIGSACVLSDRSFGKLWLSPVDYGEICFTHLFLLPGYCPLRLSVRTCGAGVWMLRFLVHWRRLLSFVFLLTLARKLWLLSLSII